MAAAASAPEWSWQELYDEQSRHVYYLRSDGGESRWAIPEKDWALHLDPDSGCQYWLNAVTGVSVWSGNEGGEGVPLSLQSLVAVHNADGDSTSSVQSPESAGGEGSGNMSMKPATDGAATSASSNHGSGGESPSGGMQNTGDASFGGAEPADCDADHTQEQEASAAEAAGISLASRRDVSVPQLALNRPYCGSAPSSPTRSRRASAGGAHSAPGSPTDRVSSPRVLRQTSAPASAAPTNSMETGYWQPGDYTSATDGYAVQQQASYGGGYYPQHHQHQQSQAWQAHSPGLHQQYGSMHVQPPSAPPAPVGDAFGSPWSQQPSPGAASAARRQVPRDPEAKWFTSSAQARARRERQRSRHRRGRSASASRCRSASVGLHAPQIDPYATGYGAPHAGYPPQPPAGFDAGAYAPVDPRLAAQHHPQSQHQQSPVRRSHSFGPEVSPTSPLGGSGHYAEYRTEYFSPQAVMRYSMGPEAAMSGTSQGLPRGRGAAPGHRRHASMSGPMGHRTRPATSDEFQPPSARGARSAGGRRGGRGLGLERREDQGPRRDLRHTFADEPRRGRRKRRGRVVSDAEAFEEESDSESDGESEWELPSGIASLWQAVTGLVGSGGRTKGVPSLPSTTAETVLSPQSPGPGAGGALGPGATAAQLEDDEDAVAPRQTAAEAVRTPGLMNLGWRRRAMSTSSAALQGSTTPGAARRSGSGAGADIGGSPGLAARSAGTSPTPGSAVEEGDDLVVGMTLAQRSKWLASTLGSLSASLLHGVATSISQSGPAIDRAIDVAKAGTGVAIEALEGSQQYQQPAGRRLQPAQPPPAPIPEAAGRAPAAARDAVTERLERGDDKGTQTPAAVSPPGAKHAIEQPGDPRCAEQGADL